VALVAGGCGQAYNGDDDPYIAHVKTIGMGMQAESDSFSTAMNCLTAAYQSAGSETRTEYEIAIGCRVPPEFLQAAANNDVLFEQLKAGKITKAQFMATAQRNNNAAWERYERRVEKTFALPEPPPD
jgi:hypothetical protein